jgi:hypothetical protein
LANSFSQKENFKSRIAILVVNENILIIMTHVVTNPQSFWTMAKENQSQKT